METQKASGIGIALDRLDISSALKTARTLSGYRPNVVSSVKNCWCSRASRSIVKAFFSEYQDASELHGYFKGLQLDDDNRRLSNPGASYQLEGLFSNLINIGAKVIVPGDRIDLAENAKKTHSIWKPKEKQFHRLFWWWEITVIESEPVWKFNYVNVPISALIKLKNNQNLNRYEKGCVRNMPLKMINSDAYFLGGIGGPWGRAPILISKARSESFALHMLLPKYIRNLAYKNNLRTYFRSHANPGGSLPAFIRNSKKSRANITLGGIASSFRDQERIQKFLWPKFIGPWDPSHFVMLSEINLQKQAGA